MVKTHENTPKEVHSVVLGRTGSGMNCFERNEVLTKITTVLESYDEVVIEEAIAKNHLLNLKNLSDDDVERTVMFVMEKSKGLKLDTPNYNLEEKYKGMLMIDSL